jgi:NAD+ synthase (glutamine-hydrolysing)
MKFKIALAQVDSVLGDVKRNIKHHLTFVEKAKHLGANLVVFPELSLTGYTVRDINWDAAINPRESPILKELKAKSNSISIVFGGIEESKDFEIFNSAFYLERGKLVHIHRKIYPPTYGMFEEMRYFNQGRSLAPFDTRWGRMGMLVCEDLWHISLPYLLALHGVQVIIGIAASPTRLGGDSDKLAIARVNTENHKAYARLLSTYLVFCNRVGYEDGVNFWGGSEVIGPGGDVVASAKLFDEDLIMAEIDSNEIRRARRLSRHFLDENPEFVSRELEGLLRKGSD